MLQLLAGTADLAAAQLLVFLTSRPEITLRAGLHTMSEGQRRHVILHHVEPSIVSHDIRMFFEHKLSQVIRHRPLLSGYTDDEVVGQLAERADGLFIWAATACRFIKDGGPHARRRLDMIVKHQALTATENLEQKLDQIYTSVLRNPQRKHFSPDELEQFCLSLKDVLGTIVVLFSSLSAPWLADLLSRTEMEVLDILCDLHSIIDVAPDSCVPIRPQHASVRDYLLDNRRCTDSRYWVDEHQAHARVAHHCLRLMDESLMKDICGLREPGALMGDVKVEMIDACVPPSLRYSCLYWGQHVQLCDDPQRLQNAVDGFIRKHLLHWLEVLALIGKLPHGIEMLALLGKLYVSITFIKINIYNFIAETEELLTRTLSVTRRCLYRY